MSNNKWKQIQNMCTFGGLPCRNSAFSGHQLDPLQLRDCQRDGRVSSLSGLSWWTPCKFVADPARSHRLRRLLTLSDSYPWWPQIAHKLHGSWQVAPPILMGIHWIYNGYTLDIQWVYNGCIIYPWNTVKGMDKVHGFPKRLIGGVSEATIPRYLLRLRQWSGTEHKGEYWKNQVFPIAIKPSCHITSERQSLEGLVASYGYNLSPPNLHISLIWIGIPAISGPRRRQRRVQPTQRALTPGWQGVGSRWPKG